MTEKEQRKKAKEFAEYWKNKGNERSESQPFWLALLRDIFGIQEPEKFIIFEENVHIDQANGFIDGYLPDTHVLIEQKGKGKDLRKPIKQSDGTYLNPFQQAKRYSSELPYSQRPRWIVTSNFSSFLVYDMENPTGEPQEILLQNLEKEYYRLAFLVDKGNENLKKEMEISIQAGEIVGKLYDEILKLYLHPEKESTLRSLNMLCVRLVFCLYAEDAGIFGKHNLFHDYLANLDASDLRRALIDLFKVLDTKIEERDPYMKEELAKFPYVNGGLFADETIEIPMLNEKVKDILLSKASEDFDWSNISPTIFGAVFESTLNPDTRRTGGMHYTSIENIHKVIDPLFLDDLQDELAYIMNLKSNDAIEKNVKKFQEKIASLQFLDPACGSGNFLTETYISLRKMENQAIETLTKGQIALGMEQFNPIQVSIGQFYGIEINDFAVTVAKTALWIAESQMMKETEEILHLNLDFLPLKSYANIVEGNALRLDWNEIIDKKELNFIMGNPPFIGARMMAQGSEQKRDVENLFGKIKDVQDLDYVTCWYKKAAEYIQNTTIEVGFVSTNSICQGSQVPILWDLLLSQYKISINFAYQTFRWNSESNQKAAVYCVIIGFSLFHRKIKQLYSSSIYRKETKLNVVKNISPYLLPTENHFVIAQKEAICDVPKMSFGNQPRDGGNYIFTQTEKEELVKKKPTIIKFLRPYIGAEEFINQKQRWCLWLKNANPAEIRNDKFIYEKIEAVKSFRENSSAKTTRGYAKVPHLFAQITQPDEEDYLLIPSVSSEKRRYIPIGFMKANAIASNAVQIVPNATLYHFGILTSNVHMAWMRTVAGRLKSDYRYSKELVYNTFPFPNPTKQQKEKIEKTAQAILQARKLYPDCSLADLYDELTMPSELRKAHQNNDRAVMEAYGFPVKNDFTESMCVGELMKRYQEMINA